MFVGFGSIGQGVLPLILRHIGISAERITHRHGRTIVGREEAARYGVKFIKQPLTRENLRRTLDPLLGRGDFLLNVSVDVSSVALIRYCWEKGAMYLDTCIEPWPGGYTDPTIPAAQRTNYALARGSAGAARRQPARRHGGAHARRQPGTGVAPGQAGAAQHRQRHRRRRRASPPAARSGRELAQRLGVKVIHIAERDTQVSSIPKEPNEFVNTWSVDGFVSEGSQPAELGWGTHERNFPARRPALRFRLRRGHLPGAAGGGDAGAQLDAAQRPLSWLSDHPRRGDFDRRLL